MSDAAPGDNVGISVQLTELSGKIELLLEKQDELAENVAKIKEAVYNPDSGLYARLRELEQRVDLRLKEIENWKETFTKFTWLIATTVAGLGLATIWRTVVG
jgi:hypothetical protein